MSQLWGGVSLERRHGYSTGANNSSLGAYSGTFEYVSQPAGKPPETIRLKATVVIDALNRNITIREGGPKGKLLADKWPLDNVAILKGLMSLSRVKSVLF